MRYEQSRIVERVTRKGGPQGQMGSRCVHDEDAILDSNQSKPSSCSRKEAKNAGRQSVSRDGEGIDKATNMTGHGSYALHVEDGCRRPQKKATSNGQGIKNITGKASCNMEIQQENQNAVK